MTPNSSNSQSFEVILDAPVTGPSVGDRTALEASAPTTDTRTNLHSFLGNLLQKHDVASSEVRIVDDNAVVSLETRMWATASFCLDNDATNKGISRWSSTPEIHKLGMRRTSSSPTVSRGRAGRSNRLSASSSSRSSRRVGNSTRAFDDGLSSGGNGSSNATWDTLPAVPLSSSVLVPSATASAQLGSTAPMIKRQLPQGVRPSSLSPPRPKSQYPPTMSSASTSAPRLPNRCQSPGMGLSMPVRTVDDFVVGGGRNSMVPVPMKPNATANVGTGNKTLFASIMSSPSLGLMDVSSLSSIPSDADDGSSVLSTNSSVTTTRTSNAKNDEIVRNSFSKGIQGSKTHHYLSKTSSSSSKESERRLRSALGSMAPRISSKEETNSRRTSKQSLNSILDTAPRTAKSSSALLQDVKKTLHQYTKLEGSYNHHSHKSSLPPSLRDFDLSAVSHKSSSTGRTLRGGV